MAMSEPFADEPFRYGNQIYVRAPIPIDFPSHGEVPETKSHLEARTTLYLSLKEAFADMAVGSGQFVYWDAGNPQKCLSPDIFTKRGVRDELFDNWKVWQRGAPDLAVEIVSTSDRRDSDWSEKLARYQASGIAEVVRFDASNEAQPIRVWDRIEGELVERSKSSPELRACVSLRLWWIVVPAESGPMLRLAHDRDGKSVLPTPSEDRLRLVAEIAEERRARTQAEHERLLEQHARAAEAQARIAAEQREAVAEQGRAAAERAAAHAEAEIERLRAEIALLRARG